jgi:hypothetical protein
MVTLLAFVPRTAAAQSSPPLVHNFSGETVRSLEQEFQADLYVLGAFDGKRRVDRFDRAATERAQPWKFYGRLGPMHFQNALEPDQGTHFSLRRTGPNLTGRLYVGIHRTFD